MTQVENAGRFAGVDAATLEQVPSQYRRPPANGRGSPPVDRARVRQAQAEPVAASGIDARPGQAGVEQGRWAASPSGADFQAIVSALYELKGEETTSAWLGAMKTGSKAYKGNSTAMKAVNSGRSTRV